jgi:hypothetical protein
VGQRRHRPRAEAPGVNTITYRGDPRLRCLDCHPDANEEVVLCSGHALAQRMETLLRLAYARLPQDDYGSHARAEIRTVLDELDAGHEPR